MTEKEIEERIDALADEMNANEEENRMMQREIDILYKTLGSMRQECDDMWVKISSSMAESKYKCAKCGEEDWR